MQDKYQDGQPCDHKGCLSHISHPCEGCCRIGGVSIKLEDRIKKIQARVDRATDGPWEQNQENVVVKGYTLFFTYMSHRNDAEFIAHARQDIPYLLAALQEANRICYTYKENSGKLFERVQELEADLQEVQVRGQGLQNQIDFNYKRLMEACKKVDMGFMGCDSPDWLADRILELESREQGLRDLLLEMVNPIHKMHWKTGIAPGDKDCHCSICRRVREALRQEGKPNGS